MRTRFTAKLLQILAVAVFAGLSSHAGATDARSATYSLDIPAQDLNSALQQLALASQHKLFYKSELVEGMTSQALKGEFTTEQALKVLLTGTNLTYDITPSAVVLIRRPQPLSSLEEKADSARRDGNKRSMVQIRLAQTAQGNASAAQGAQAESASKDEAVGASKIDEIIVTAQKREQRALDVPMTISTLSSSEIESKGISSLKTLSFAVPGMVIYERGPGASNIYLRGVGNSVGSTSHVGLYLDEVAVTTSNNTGVSGQIDLVPTDLERIEVLHGPQGTLYGGGAVGGTIRFITKNPELDRFGFKGDVAAAFTEDGSPSQEIKAVLNAPLVENVFGIRIAGTLRNGGGWIDQLTSAGKREDANNRDLTDVRVKALWRPSDAFSVNAMAILHRNRGDLWMNISEEDRTSALPPIYPDTRTPYHDDYNLFNLTATYDFGPVRLLSSSSYTKATQDYTAYYTLNARSLFPDYQFYWFDTSEKKLFTQELRLNSTGTGPWSWTAGLFYRDYKDIYTADGGLSFAGFVGPYTEFADRKEPSWAVFADVSYHLNERTEIGAGVRYFQDDQKSLSVVGEQKASFNSTDPRVFISYQLRPDIKVYANAGTGFRSGGFNNLGQPPYQPESLISYELGTKMLLLERRLSLELAGFYSDYTDMVRRGFILTSTGGFNVNSNIGEASIKGVDWSLRWWTTDRLNVYLNGTLLDAQVDKTSVPTNTLPGDKLDYIADYSYSVGAGPAGAVDRRFPARIRAGAGARDLLSGGRGAHAGSVRIPPDRARGDAVVRASCRSGGRGRACDGFRGGVLRDHRAPARRRSLACSRAGDHRDRQSRAAAHRQRLARRARAGADRNRVDAHQPGGAAAKGAPSRRHGCRGDRRAGQLRDRQHACARARALAGQHRARRPDVRAARARHASQRNVRREGTLSQQDMAAAHAGSFGLHASVPDRAGGPYQRGQARARLGSDYRFARQGRPGHPCGDRQRPRVHSRGGTDIGDGTEDHAVPRQRSRRKRVLRAAGERRGAHGQHVPPADVRRIAA